MLQPEDLGQIKEYIKSNLSISVTKMWDYGGRKLRIELSFAGEEISTDWCPLEENDD